MNDFTTAQQTQNLGIREQNTITWDRHKPKQSWGAVHVKEYSGFTRNFNDKKDASVFAKIILSIVCYSLSVYTALTSSRSASAIHCDFRSVELASVSPATTLCSSETAVKPHACEMLLKYYHSIPSLCIVLQQILKHLSVCCFISRTKK